MFFALSGFLVAGSLERTKALPTFFGLRVLRIIPALAFEVTLSALLLGPMLTTYTMEQYFSSYLFYGYFLNITGDIHYILPGLFHNNPYPDVINGQLWTIPFELMCYAALGTLALLGVFPRRNLLLWALVLLQLAYSTLIVLRPHPNYGPVTGSVLVASFLAGVLVYRFKDRIVWSTPLFVGALVLALVLLAFPNGERLVALPAAYVTVYLGLMNPPRNRLVLSGDYSYGTFLYGFPLQQAFASWGPAVQHWYWNILAIVPTALALAVFSWWFIEKPALKLRWVLAKFEDWYLTQRNNLVAPVAERWPAVHAALKGPDGASFETGPKKA